MNITLQMLGTGSAFAKTYDNNNALVVCGGYTLLIDCGITAPRALHRMNIPFDKIDGVFISHIHADHVGGLEEYAFQMHYIYNKKPDLWIPSSLRKPIWENTLRGGMDNPVESMQDLSSYFHVHELEEGHSAHIRPGFTLEIMPTLHIPGKSSYAAYLNGFLYYSADSLFDDVRLKKLYAEEGMKHVLHECQLQPPGHVHTTLDQLLTLPEEIQAITHLMHYGDDMEAFIGRTGRMTFLRQGETYRFEA